MTTYKELPIDKVHAADDNLRTRVGDVRELAASIRTHGIIEPLVVTPHGDDTYLLVAGHRRLAAAHLAELDIVPVIVRSASDDDRVELALIENLHRVDLNPIEEAAGYFRLVEAGRTQKELAARVGRPAKHVAGRLALLELPKRVQAKVARGDIAIAAATELLRVEDHPELLSQLTAALLDGEYDEGDVRWVVDQELEKLTRAAKRAEVVATLATKGVRAIDFDGWHIPRDVGTELGASYGGLELDTRKHTKEPCHAVVVNGDGRQIPVCTDSSRHAKRGDSAVKVERRRGTDSPAEADRKAQHKAMKEAARARQAQLGELLRRRLPKGDVVRLILRQFVESANQNPAKLACELLGIEAPSANVDYYGTRAVNLLFAEAGDTDAGLQRVALALAFALAEERMTPSWGSWASTQVTNHFGFLDTVGYQRSELEHAELERAAQVLEERATERQQLADAQDTPDGTEAAVEDDELDEAS